MNSKQLTFLLVIGIALGGLGWLAYQKQRSPYTESSARLGEKVLPGFPLNDADPSAKAVIAELGAF